MTASWSPLLPQAQAIQPSWSQTYQGPVPLQESPSSPWRTTCRGSAGCSSRPIALLPPSQQGGADAHRAGGAGPGQGDPGGRLHGLQPADAGGHEAAWPADGDRLVWRRPVMPAGRVFASPSPGWHTLPFSPARRCHEPQEAKRQARALLFLHLRNPVPVRLMRSLPTSLLPGGAVLSSDAG